MRRMPRHLESGAQREAGFSGADSVVDVDEEGANPIPIAKIDRRKQVIGGVLTVAVLAFVFLGIFPKFADYGAAWVSIQKMSTASLVLLLAVTLVNIFVYVLPYQASMPGLRYGNGFVVRQTSFMISNTIPAGGAFGLGIQYAMLSGYGYGASATTTAIAATSTWNLLVTLGLPVFGVLILVFQGGATSNEVLGALAGLAALIVLVGVFALVLRSESAAARIGRLGDRIVGSVSRTFRRHPKPDAQDTAGGEGAVSSALLHFLDTVRGVVQERWGQITATSAAQQLCQFAILAVAFFGIAGADGGFNVGELFAAFAIARLAGFIPVTPGGLGTVDAALVGLMVSLGADKDTALAADLVWRAASYFPQVIIGVITFLVWRKQAGPGAKRNAAQAEA